MAGANPKQAVENFVQPLQEALGCLTTATIARQGQYHIGAVYALVVNRGEPVLVQRASARGRVALRIAQQYRIVEAEGERGPYKVETRGYMYSVANEAGQEIAGYHWHPAGPSQFRRPHLHLEVGAQVAYAEIAAAHFPTSRVSVEQFLRFAIETFRLRTRRTDWRSVLNRTDALSRRWQTWG